MCYGASLFTSINPFQMGSAHAVVNRAALLFVVSHFPVKATFRLTISMHGERATGKIQRNKYHHESCGPSLMGEASSVSLIFTHGTHQNIKNRRVRSSIKGYFSLKPSYHMIVGDRSRSLGSLVNCSAIVTIIWKPNFHFANDPSDCQRSQRS